MKILNALTVVAVTVLAANTASALEFQPIGSIGMGGAGVARTFDGAAAYWNPGALAFEADKTAIKIGGGVGYQIDDDLANNVDRLSTLGDPTTGLNVTTGGTTAENLAAAGQIAQILGVMNDIVQGGNASLRLNGSAFIGARVGHFGTGMFGTLAGAGTPDPDLTNIRPDGATSATDLAVAIGATTTGTPTFFTPQQFAAIASAFGGGATGSNIAFAFDRQLAASNASHVSPGSAAEGLVQLGNAIGGSTAGNFTTNQSSLQTRGIAYFEVPLAYGYPIDLGRFGTLGIGGAVKAMAGRVYISTTKLFNTSAGDIFRNITKSHEDSLSWGIDLGALWKWRIVNVGVVAKNLNTPKFSTSDLVTTEDGFRIRPQVRGGVSVDLLAWLSVATDIDLTRNESAQSGVTSQNFGGGLELHPVAWFKLRMGAYRNIGAGGFGPVATAGLTVGPRWFNLDLDAAAATETNEYNGHRYPREGNMQLSFNSQF
jgi:hypothetical protein